MIRAVYFTILFLICSTVNNAVAVNLAPKALIYYGGGKKIKEGDEHLLSRYDMLLLDRYRYYDLKEGAWDVIRKLNPNIKIYLYQVGPEVAENHDDYKAVYLNDIGRFKVSRGHSMGSISDHQDFFLKNRYKQNVRLSTRNEYFLLDFANKEFQDYWVEATIKDVSSQPWRADGINIDNCLTYSGSFVKNILGLNAGKYTSKGEWDQLMNEYINAITEGMHAANQKVLVNRGNTRTKQGEAAWLALDETETPPDVVYEEGAFAVSWGKGDVQFFSEKEWLRQVKLPSKIKHSDVLYLSHTDLDEEEEGFDNWGNKVSFHQILQYSLGSYFLAMPIGLKNYYFSFDADRDKGDYRNIWWFNYYNYDPGAPVGEINVSNDSNINIYWREFDSGYVYVNPTYKDAVIKPAKDAALFYPTENVTIDRGVVIKSHHALLFKKIIK